LCWSFGLPVQPLDCFDGKQNKQFDFVTLGFVLYSLHDGQSTVCTTADDAWVPLPGDFLFYRERRVAELLAKVIGRFFSRSRISPRSMMTSYSYVLPSIWMEPKENLSKRIRELWHSWLQALFFDVIALKADQHCSTSLLPQCDRLPPPLRNR
jgi:hypothetical protein